jgi:MtN3 and saliva related transmembrane protein
MDQVEIIGHAGALISSLTFVPQVIQIWKTKKVNDLNIYMILIVTISTIIWVVYGLLKNILPVILCNTFICLLSLVMLYFKLRYQQPKQ